MCEIEAGVSEVHDVCPLCNAVVSNASPGSAAFLEGIMKRHVSDHLKQLAYFVACPAGQMQEDESDLQDDSDSEDGLQSDIRSLQSRDTRYSKRDIQVANVKAFLEDQKKVAADPGLFAGAQLQAGTAQTSQTPTETRRKPVQPADTGRSDPSFPVHVQLPPQHERYYSRKNLLKQLEDGTKAPGLICLLYGMGGVGKTLAAVDYSHIHKGDFDAIFWLQADTAPGLADSYLQMVMALGLANSGDDHHHVIAKGRHWLQETSECCSATLVFQY
jgi:hypothetical protein